MISVHRRLVEQATEGQPPWAADLGSPRLAPRKALDSKNATLRMLRFDRDDGPGGCGRPEIESDHARLGKRVCLGIAADHTISAHKASNKDYQWPDRDSSV